MTYRTRHPWTILLTTCILAQAARTNSNRAGARLRNTNFFYVLQNNDRARDSLESIQKQQVQASNNTENPIARHDGVYDTDLYNKEDKEENITIPAIENGRFLGAGERQYEPRKRKGRSSYGSRSLGFHRSREGVRNGDRTAFGRNGCSGMRYETGELKRVINCDDRVISSDYTNSNSLSSSSTSLSPLQELHDTYSSQMENYSVSDNWKMTAPPEETQVRRISAAKRPSNAGSSRSTDAKKEFENLRHEGRNFGTGETLRNGRQTMQGGYDTHEGEVSQAPEPYAASEPRQRDAVSSYYDFLINEGSYKFWAVFQVVTACLLIYSAFAAIYYAKYTFSMMDYPDYLDEGFFFKRSGEAYVTTTTAKPSSYSFLGLSPQTFQRIMNALSSKKYS